jgi:hypothetical protein
VQGSYVIGQGASHNLGGDHPVSFSYDEAYTKMATNSLKAVNELLNNTVPAGNNLINQTVGDAFLKGTTHDVQCSSCHDVHRQKGDSNFNSNLPINTANHNPLLLVYQVAQDGYGSGLCRSCHNK